MNYDSHVLSFYGVFYHGSPQVKSFRTFAIKQPPVRTGIDYLRNIKMTNLEVYNVHLYGFHRNYVSGMDLTDLSDRWFLALMAYTLNL